VGDPPVGYLYYTRAGDANGGGSWTEVTVDTGANNYTNASLAIVGGNPGVAYVADSVALRYASNSQADGLGTWTVYSVSMDPSADFAGVSLAEVSSRPAISFIDNNAKSLYFAIAPNADGSGVWTKSTVGTGGFNYYSSLAIIGGLPGIAAYKSVGVAPNVFSHLFYFVNSAADGSGTWSGERAVKGNSEPGVGQYCSLKEVSGQPAAAYFNADADAPAFARKSG